MAIRIWNACNRVLTLMSDGERARALVLVLAFHLLFLGVIALGLRLPASQPEIRELRVRFFSEARLERSSPPPEPVLPVVEPPQIVIANDPSGTIAAVAAASILAPRPDPAHPNEAVVTDRAAASGLVLKLLVRSDGSIGDAQVSASSGDPATDSAGLAYVKAHWRFLPAMLRDTAIEYWTTVAVPFRTRA
jgi:hypothetical protein